MRQLTPSELQNIVGGGYMHDIGYAAGTVIGEVANAASNAVSKLNDAGRALGVAIYNATH